MPPMRPLLYGPALVLAGVAGCGLPPSPSAPEPVSIVAPEGCEFFPAGTMVTVVGETPLFELGLADRGRSPDPPGAPVYVTTEPISFAQGGPSRMYCVIYDPEEADGLFNAAGPVPEGWTPPDG